MRTIGSKRLSWAFPAAALFLLLSGCAQSEDRTVSAEAAGRAPVVRDVRATDGIDGIRGRVDHAFDGDSFVMRSEGRKVNVRVFGIDAPEKGQPFSKKSRTRSKQLLEGTEIVVRVTTASDAHGRVVGDVFLPDGRNYAHVMVAEGLAWQFRRYSKDPDVAALERDAQRENLGLWRDGSPEPPWEYRRRKPRR